MKLTVAFLLLISPVSVISYNCGVVPVLFPILSYQVQRSTVPCDPAYWLAAGFNLSTNQTLALTNLCTVLALYLPYTVLLIVELVFLCFFFILQEQVTSGNRTVGIATIVMLCFNGACWGAYEAFYAVQYSSGSGEIGPCILSSNTNIFFRGSAILYGLAATLLICHFPFRAVVNASPNPQNIPLQQRANANLNAAKVSI